MERNILLTVEYDGTDFSGWQRQPNRRTAQGVLEDALSHVCGKPVTVDGVSRTDAGVHAKGQMVTLRGEFGIPTDRIPRAVNNLIASPSKDGDLRIIKAEEMPEGFHARFDAKGKTYCYTIHNGEYMPVALRNFRYRVGRPLDVEAMQRAAEQIVGTHDFACFQASGGTPRETTVRTIWDLTIREVPVTGGGESRVSEGVADGSSDTAIVEGLDLSDAARTVDTPAWQKELEIRVSGDGFLYNMVRIIVGTLVDVGLGKIAPENLETIILSKDRQTAGHTAPPQGLCLEKVYY